LIIDVQAGYFMSEALSRQPAKQAPPETQSLTLWEVMCSVFAAGFGVQSRDNKVRDFSRGKPLQFIAAGLLFTVAFLISLIVLVNIIV
jgi:hypothetical protein